MKTIPLNSLVFLVDLVSSQVLDYFEPYEFVTTDKILLDLVGPDQDRPDLKHLVYSELERIVFSKLSLGERVVVDAPELRADARVAMAHDAVNRGVNVFYFVDDIAIRRDLIKGDRIADVVDLVSISPEVVRKLPDVALFDELKSRGFAGITVVPDVHGNLNAMRNAISWAKSRNHFMIFLGDLVDYGIDTLEVVDVAYQLIIRGEAEAIMGNHEKKIFRYLSQTDKSNYIRLSDGNRVTINRIKALSKFDHDRWVNRFKSLANLMRNHRTCDNFIFTHGAVRPDMFKEFGQRQSGTIESLCLFGETDDSVKRSDGFPNRVYNWVDQLLPDQVAIVGHDIRSDFEPMTVVGALGGTALFMDTGCGKGGHLSTVDIRFTESGAKIGNFNIH